MGLDFLHRRDESLRRWESRQLRHARSATLFDSLPIKQRALRVDMRSSESIDLSRRHQVRLVNGVLLVLSNRQTVLADTANVPDDIRRNLQRRPQGIATARLQNPSTLSDSVEVILDEES